MRDRNKAGNVYYAELFVADKRDFEFVYSVGIDLITNQYMTEHSKYIEHSFVAYNENTYRLIDTKEFLQLLEQSFSRHFIPEQTYTQLKTYEKPNLEAIQNLSAQYEKIAQKMIREQRKKIFLPAQSVIESQHVYANYHNYRDENDFELLYLNRYSKNHGWCVRLAHNEIGYKLVVVYSENPITDLYEDSEYINFLKRYYNEVDTYASYDVYEKQLTAWEMSEIIHLLEDEQFYALLAPKMKLTNQESVGYTGECQIKVKYTQTEINGYTSNDSKEACGIDFFKLIDRCRNIAEHGSSF